jgi:hypothetical protein
VCGGPLRVRSGGGHGGPRPRKTSHAAGRRGCRERPLFPGPPPSQQPPPKAANGRTARRRQGRAPRGPAPGVEPPTPPRRARLQLLWREEPPHPRHRHSPQEVVVVDLALAEAVKVDEEVCFWGGRLFGVWRGRAFLGVGKGNGAAEMAVRWRCVGSAAARAAGAQLRARAPLGQAHRAGAGASCTRTS